MRQAPEPSPANDVSRPILGAGFALLALGVVLLVVSLVLATRPALQPIGNGLRAAAPYALLLGLALLAVYGLLRRKTDESLPRPHEPTLFGKDSTDFVSLDRGSTDDPTLPVQARRPPAPAVASPPEQG